jgi:site-specific recombinase XerD
MLKAKNRSPLTIRVDGATALEFQRFCEREAIDSLPALLERRHVEAFILELLERRSPATALNRFRALNTCFRWLVEEEETYANHMARMRALAVPRPHTPS